MDLTAERTKMVEELKKHQEQVLLITGYIACLDKQLAEQNAPPKE